MENLVFECVAVLPLSVVVFLVTHLSFEHLPSIMPKNLRISAVWLFFNSFELQKNIFSFLFPPAMHASHIWDGAYLPTAGDGHTSCLASPSSARNTKALSGTGEHQSTIWCRGTPKSYISGAGVTPKQVPPARNTKSYLVQGTPKRYLVQG